MDIQNPTQNTQATSNLVANQVQTLKAFVTAQGFTQIVPKIRVNVNGYPYLTFVTANNKAENVYFSRNEASKVLEKGFVMDKEYLQKLSVISIVNDAGETRLKLTTGNSNRMELDFL